MLVADQSRLIDLLSIDSRDVIGSLKLKFDNTIKSTTIEVNVGKQLPLGIKLILHRRYLHDDVQD